MDFADIVINNTQTKEFARIFRADISEYVRLNPKAYADFLDLQKSEETKARGIAHIKNDSNKHENNK